MSHEDHKTSGPRVPVEGINGDEFSQLTINDLVVRAIYSRSVGVGNALEASFIVDTSAGSYSVHFHLCLSPAGAQPAATHPIKH